ncbi:MAG: carbohydrate ABC transporter permease, partial [Candidatus Brocadiia bacterium]
MPKLLRIFASAGTLFVFGLPLLWMTSTSLKSAAEFTRNPWWFPASPTFVNYSRVISDSTILNFFVNSLLVGIGSVLLTLALAAPAAYALARFPFRGRRAVEIVLLLGLTIPVHITLLPLLRITATMHLSDGLFGLSLVYAAFGTALTVFLLKTAFQQVPRELEEAAMLDGCGRFRTFFLISLPLIRPTLAVAAVYNFVMNYNEFAFALSL